MRGLQAAELAAGEFLEGCNQICQRNAAELLIALPADLKPAESQSCLSEFNAAATHLCYYYTLKLTHVGEAPWVSFKVSHANIAIAHDGLRAALASRSDHPRIRRLQLELQEQAIAWMSGRDIFEAGLEDICDCCGGTVSQH